MKGEVAEGRGTERSKCECSAGSRSRSRDLTFQNILHLQDSSSVWVLLFLLFSTKIEESFHRKPLPGSLQRLADHKQGCGNQLFWESQDF